MIEDEMVFHENNRWGPNLAALSAAATEPFDWAGLWQGACQAWDHRPPFVPTSEGDQYAAAYLRTRIEAAFVPVDHYAAVISDHDELLQCEIARAEAAEAENAKLLRTLEEIDFEAFNTIPPDGKEAAFAALTRIAKLIDPYRKYK